jgi:transposase-like protein
VFYINTFNALEQHYRRWQDRQLESHYITAFVVKIPLVLKQREDGAAMALYMLIGLKEDGAWDVMGLWIGRDYAAGAPLTPEEQAEANALGDQILNEIKTRGVEHIDTVFTDGLAGFGAAFTAAFPDAAQGACALVWFMNAALTVAPEDHDALVAGLNAVYAAQTREETQEAYESFLATWEGQYPDLAAQLKAGWQKWLDGFDAMSSARDAGLDFAGIAGVVADIAAAVGESDGNADDLIYVAFLQLLKHFPEY